MNKRISVGVTAAMVMIAVTITFAATLILSTRLFDKKVASFKERAVMYDKISEIDALVRESFYSAITDLDMQDSTIEGYISGLNDSYSKYLTAEEYANMLSVQKGKSLSFGFDVAKNAQGYMEVKAVVSNSLAAKVGILTGDIVSSVGTTAVYASTYDEGLAAMNVPEGTVVSFVFNRNGHETKADLTNEKMDSTVVTKYIVNDKVGYIRILSFNDKTPEQFKTNYEALKAAGVESVIYDVRDCKSDSTSLDGVSAILNMLLSKSGTLVSGKYADGTVKLLATADGSGNSMPAVVIVNQNTEYQGEIFAQALNEMNKTPIVGNNTKGHGTYQKVLPLSDGSAVVVSTAIIQSASGQTFNKTGITPEYLVIEQPAVLADHALPSEAEDPQFARAMQVLNGITK